SRRYTLRGAGGIPACDGAGVQKDTSPAPRSSPPTAPGSPGDHDLQPAPVCRDPKCLLRFLAMAFNLLHHLGVALRRIVDAVILLDGEPFVADRLLHLLQRLLAHLRALALVLRLGDLRNPLAVQLLHTLRRSGEGFELL